MRRVRMMYSTATRRRDRLLRLVESDSGLVHARRTVDQIHVAVVEAHPAGASGSVIHDVILVDHPAAFAFEKSSNGAVTRRSVARSLFTAAPNDAPLVAVARDWSSGSDVAAMGSPLHAASKAIPVISVAACLILDVVSVELANARIMRRNINRPVPQDLARIAAHEPPDTRTPSQKTRRALFFHLRCASAP